MNNENTNENVNESLDEKIKNYNIPSGKTDELKSKETYKLRQSVKNIFKEDNRKRLDDEVESNKEIHETIIKSSDMKKQAYDFLSETLGIDLYKQENKNEIKKAYKLINKVKKDMKILENVLNGEEVYDPPSLNNDALITYLSAVDPKKKGLYFRFNECKEITLIFKNEEVAHKNYIEMYENQIDNLNEQLASLQGTDNLDKLKSITKEKMDYKRKIEGHTRTLEDIYNDLDNYIIKSKHLENKIYEFQNALNASRVLSNNMELSLGIIGPDHMSLEGQTLDNAMKNLSQLQKSGNLFTKFVEEYATQKNSKNDQLYSKVDKTSKDSNGEEMSTKILNKNKSIFNYSKANMKAMRDTYFKDIGY